MKKNCVNMSTLMNKEVKLQELEDAGHWHHNTATHSSATDLNPVCAACLKMWLLGAAQWLVAECLNANCARDSLFVSRDGHCMERAVSTPWADPDLYHQVSADCDQKSFPYLIRNHASHGQTLTVGARGHVRCREWAGTSLPLTISLPPSHSQIQSCIQTHRCFLSLCFLREPFQTLPTLTGQDHYFIFRLKPFLSTAAHLFWQSNW